MTIAMDLNRTIQQQSVAYVNPSVMEQYETLYLSDISNIYVHPKYD
eukprot:CAMPEP_0201589284 /NCGR_PEP_ID=MMETSP0190_2-20130828/164958_1 /ASSEMBLY_ACC=CAM_ASM_000263 /TAXON_ID=37353 /ORGANISM="Rosalina sp." /LENGTH=45 /DNA_ID= /DNA_START= /DNA_END= /DNA_ORIENTATION=